MLKPYIYNRVISLLNNNNETLGKRHLKEYATLGKMPLKDNTIRKSPLNDNEAFRKRPLTENVSLGMTTLKDNATF